jgi:hypothetical protein
MQTETHCNALHQDPMHKPAQFHDRSSGSHLSYTPHRTPTLRRKTHQSYPHRQVPFYIPKLTNSSPIIVRLPSHEAQPRPTTRVPQCLHSRSGETRQIRRCNHLSVFIRIRANARGPVWRFLRMQLGINHAGQTVELSRRCVRSNEAPLHFQNPRPSTPSSLCSCY